MDNREIITGDKNTYIDDGLLIIAEHLKDVFEIENIIRTLQAKTMERIMSADQSESGYNQRMRYRIENEFYEKIYKSILQVRKEQK
jgi:hypothetical protein